LGRCTPYYVTTRSELPADEEALAAEPLWLVLVCGVWRSAAAAHAAAAREGSTVLQLTCRRGGVATRDPVVGDVLTVANLHERATRSGGSPITEHLRVYRPLAGAQ
jgi:hypothetical protein